MTTRRNALKFVAGSAVGALFTPAPWRLVRDTALWSENWPGIPQPAAGEIKAKLTRCALCPAGCAVRARCVNDQPVGLAGVDGGLCPLGVTGHHFPYHPARLAAGPVSEARALLGNAVARGARMAVLDLRPGRTASWMYRGAMAERKGLYLTAPGPQAAIDLTAAKTVISLGVPLFEGWLAPAAAFAARDNFRLIQIEPVFSHTAAMADEWMPSHPDIAALANQMAAQGPVLVIDPLMSAPVVALNRTLGGWGKTIGPVPEKPVLEAMKKAAAPVTDPGAVADGSIGVLLIDESAPGPYLPWPEIEPKLAPEAVVIALSWWREGYGRHTRLVLPTPVYPETADDVPYTRLPVTPLLKPPAGVVDPVEFITGRKPAVETAAAAKEKEAAAPAGNWLVPIPWQAAVTTPLFSKLHRESDLLLAPGQAAVHPSSGWTEHEHGFLAGARGKLPVEILLDAGVPPGKVRFVPTPEILDLCGSQEPKVVRA